MFRTWAGPQNGPSGGLLKSGGDLFLGPRQDCSTGSPRKFNFEGIRPVMTSCSEDFQQTRSGNPSRLFVVYEYLLPVSGCVAMFVSTARPTTICMTTPGTFLRSPLALRLIVPIRDSSFSFLSIPPLLPLSNLVPDFLIHSLYPCTDR